MGKRMPLICVISVIATVISGCYENPRYKDNSAYRDFSRSVHRENKKQLINLSKEIHNQVRRHVRRLGDEAWQRRS